jgi:hypothetical protein
MFVFVTALIYNERALATTVLLLVPLRNRLTVYICTKEE